MTIPTSTFIVSLVLTFLAISTQSIENEGISSYCEKSRLYPFWYVPTPVECCDYRGTCDKIIGPNETKYGLTNPDTRWSRRHCTCDKELYKCVTRSLSPVQRTFARVWGFRLETCFSDIAVKINGTWQFKANQFWSLLDIVSMVLMD